MTKIKCVLSSTERRRDVHLPHLTVYLVTLASATPDPQFISELTPVLVARLHGGIIIIIIIINNALI